MMRDGSVASGEGTRESIEGEWVSFPGGELEGQRPRVMCPVCRERLRVASRISSKPEPRVPGADFRAPSPEHRAPSCFQCYRVDQARQRALRAARNLNTASEARFQDTLPFEPVNRARLERLRAERSTARAGLKSGSARFADRRRHAQIAARHALDRIAAGLRSRGALNDVERHPAIADAIHAAELQLPAAWLPFVVSR
jgi:hypothetical protein